LILALVSAFGIYGCVQFIRGKSVKPLVLALALGVAVDLIGLIAFPIIQPMLVDQEQMINRDVKRVDEDDSDIAIKPWEDRIDSQRIMAGVAVIIIYAGLSLYLMSPPVKKYLFRCRGDRVP